MFSVIVPVYNHAPYLAQGVVSALRSPLVSEVLVVDDGSSDASARVLEQLEQGGGGRVRDLTRSREGNRGAHCRLNQLVEAARYDWVAVLNSDDAFVPGRFEAIQARSKRSQASFVFGHLLIMDDSGCVTGTKKGVLQPEYPFPSHFDAVTKACRGEIADLLANQNFVATTSNMVFTKALHGQVGGFRDLRYVHDWDFALRAAITGPCTYMPQFVSIYRSHATNTIKTDSAAVAQEVRQVFRDVLADFPALQERADFGAALEGNRYLRAA
jgi:glycosyltransferase involved in cell wall biosynthesis